MVLSKVELNQVCISPKEALMLVQCLEGRDSFFGGFESLIKTIGSLALIPKNRQVFLDIGLIQLLKDSALKKAKVPIGIFNALLCVIPDPEDSKHSKATDNSIKTLLTSDHSFMRKICDSSEEVCKGLAILLSPKCSRKQGIIAV